MTKQTDFIETLSSCKPMTLLYTNKKPNKGYFCPERINKLTLPKQWYCYDIRHDRNGYLSTIENHVLIDFAGCFLTMIPLYSHNLELFRFSPNNYQIG